MIRRTYYVPLKEGQTLFFAGLGDMHADTDSFDRVRFERFVSWLLRQEQQGNLVRLVGVGDYADLASTSERRHLGQEELHETTYDHIERHHLRTLKRIARMLRPIRHCLLGLLTGHHYYRFGRRRTAGPEWQGRSSDEWLAHQLGCDYLGTGSTLFRLAFHKGCPGRGCSHPLHLDVLALHGAGGAQTPGGRVQKRIRFAEIAPTAHLVMSGHDNARLGYPRSGLDYERGEVKRYVIGTGAFQRSYLDDEMEAGYAERAGLIPADLWPAVAMIWIDTYRGKRALEYYVIV